MAKRVEAKPEDMRGHILIDSDIQLPFIDRIRLIFGSKLMVQTQVHTRWRVGEFNAANLLLIEKFTEKWRFRFSELFSGLYAWYKNNISA